MTSYRPFVGDDWVGRDITIDAVRYTFAAETSFVASDMMAYQREGKKAKVYKLTAVDGTASALKVFHRQYSVVDHVASALQLRNFVHLPGMRVCDRHVISDREAAAIGEPALSWSVLMPWIDGQPWADYIEHEVLSRATSIALAQETSRLLAGLESKRLAHTDISSTNIMFRPTAGGFDIQLIDVEDMYNELLKRPEYPTDGSPGYAHPANRNKGCWNAAGDRFAGAMLLAELLTLHDSKIRSVVSDASLFSNQELCGDNAKSRIVYQALRTHSERIARLFDRAWRSQGLTDCPLLSEWATALDAIGPVETPSAPVPSEPPRVVPPPRVVAPAPPAPPRRVVPPPQVVAPAPAVAPTPAVTPQVPRVAPPVVAAPPDRVAPPPTPRADVPLKFDLPLAGQPVAEVPHYDDIILVPITDLIDGDDAP
ncbi:serine/threonine-protein kinase [Dactylosporangium sp. NPDC049140]|uniref:serine/threonine-protein kinase n=1 Tax=Dactylosporangium sp. NPDC049140 TaxID=3155647 RepID=UPI003411446C